MDGDEGHRNRPLRQEEPPTMKPTKTAVSSYAGANAIGQAGRKQKDWKQRDRCRVSIGKEE